MDYLFHPPITLETAFINCNYCLRYGIHDMAGSAKKIYHAASGTPKDHLTILLAHNGPTGSPICCSHCCYCYLCYVES